MKKLLVILCAIVLAVGATSCKKDKEGAADKNIANAVSGMTVPRTLNDGTTLTECTYADKVLTFTCEVDAKAFKKIDEEKSQGKTLEFLNKGLFPRNLVKTVKQANASIKYVFYSGNDSITFTFTPDQLEAAY